MKNTMILLLILLLASLPVCALAAAGNIPHTGGDYDYILRSAISGRPFFRKRNTAFSRKKDVCLQK